MKNNDISEKLLVMILAAKLGVVKIEDLNLGGFNETEIREGLTEIKEKLNKLKTS